MTLDSINAWIAAEAERYNRRYGIAEDEAANMIRHSFVHGLVTAGEMVEKAFPEALGLIDEISELSQQVEGP